MDFTATLEDCVQRLRISDDIQSAPLPLPLPLSSNLPPPIVHSRSADSVTVVRPVSEDAKRRSRTVSVASETRTLRDRARAQTQNKDLHKAFKTIRKKELHDGNDKLSQGKNESLKRISATFEEQAKEFTRKANACVLTQRTEITVLNLKQLVEQLEMVLILTSTKRDFSTIISKLHAAMNTYLAGLPASPKAEENAVAAARGSAQAMKRVKASLVKKIHVEMTHLQSLSSQMTCIVNYIADVDIDHACFMQLFATMKSFCVAATKLWDAVASFKEVERLEGPSRSPNNGGGPSLSNRASALMEDGGVNVWEEKCDIAVMDANAAEIKVGNLNQLILKLTSPVSYDSKFMKVFITTYQSFTSPWVLFQKLLEVYHAPSNTPKDTLTHIQFRVMVVLKYWVENQLDDFDDDLVLTVQDFISKLAQVEGLKKMADALQRYLQEKIVERSARTTLWFQEPMPYQIPEVCWPDLLLEVDAQLIAEQLTLVDYQIYKSIEASELLNQSWNKPKLKHRAPNIVSLITRSTRVSFWIATMILTQNDITARSRMYEKFIDIGKCLKKMNNFNTMMGVIAGINLAPIHRLKKTHKRVPPSKIEAFKKLVNFMDAEGNMRNYRKGLSQAQPPAIPYLGTSLTDLTFIEDGSNDHVGELINMKKRFLLTETIMMLQSYQQTPFPFEIMEPFFTFLEALPALEDNDLWDTSNFLEPKERKK
eukprot:TRINITY_DN4053_c0_g1_i1.p1 TRINITY_DN4053_c0_g1~~TRINITY_DN4053_c0_g1_i1.p1  ORF type:complete len:816 (+),score=199.17 TRINITY_DN4053_c0_g1_i1:322-2448(+)